MIRNTENGIAELSSNSGWDKFVFTLYKCLWEIYECPSLMKGKQVGKTELSSFEYQTAQEKDNIESIKTKLESTHSLNNSQK